MFDVIAPDTHSTLDRIAALIAADPKDARIDPCIAQLRRAATAIIDASLTEADVQARNAARVVADGLMAAASICDRLREERGG